MGFYCYGRVESRKRICMWPSEAVSLGDIFAAKMFEALHGGAQ